MVWWELLTSDQKITVFVSFGAALLGGLISLLSALGVFWVSAGSDRKSRRQQEKSEQASLAFQAFSVLASNYIQLCSLNSTIDEVFKECVEHGQGDLSPGVKVVPITGLPEKLSEVDPVHCAFLLKNDKSETYNKLLQFQFLCQICIASIHSFNKLRTEYTDQVSRLIESGLEARFSEDGQQVSTVLEGSVGGVFSAREGVLNLIMGQVTENLEKAISVGREVLPAYQQVAHSVFEDLFPVKTIGFGDEKC